LGAKTLDEVLDATEASSPKRLDLIEQTVRRTHRVHLTVHAMPPRVPMLADQASALENCHMLLHCGEAHRVTMRQVGH